MRSFVAAAVAIACVTCAPAFARTGNDASDGHPVLVAQVTRVAAEPVGVQPKPPVHKASVVKQGRETEAQRRKIKSLPWLIGAFQ